VGDSSQQLECVYNNENLIPILDRDLYVIIVSLVLLDLTQHPVLWILGTFLKGVKGSERSW